MMELAPARRLAKIRRYLVFSTLWLGALGFTYLLTSGAIQLMWNPTPLRYQYGTIDVLDKFLPLIAASIITFFALRGAKIGRHFDRWFFVGLGLLAAVTLLVHWPHLQQNFFKEDIGIQIKDALSTSPLNIRYFQYYPLSPFSLLYALVGAHPLVFTSVGLGLHVVLNLLVFVFLAIITRNRLIALGATLLFATAPAYLDTFNWLGVSIGSGVALSLFVGTLIIVAWTARQRTFTTLLMVMTTAWILATLNFGLTRTGMIPLAALGTAFFVHRQSSIDGGSIVEFLRRYALWIAIMLFFAFMMMVQNTYYSVGEHQVDLTALAARTINATTYLYPFEFQHAGIHFLKQFFPISAPNTLFIGLIIAELLVPLAVLGFVRNAALRWIGLFGYGWFAVTLVPAAIYGMVDNNLGNTYRAFDLFAYTPGSRYLELPLVGYVLTIGVILFWLWGGIVRWIPWLQTQTRKVLIGAATLVTIAILAIFLGLNTLFYHRFFVHNQSIPLQRYLERIATIPNDNAPVLIFTPRGSAVDSFLSPDDLQVLLRSKRFFGYRIEDQAIDVITQNRIDPQHVYYWYYDQETEHYFDRSEKLPQEYPQLLEAARRNVR